MHSLQTERSVTSFGTSLEEMRLQVADLVTDA